MLLFNCHDKAWAAVVICATILATPLVVQGQEQVPVATGEERKTVEPVFRVSKLPANSNETEKSPVEASLAAEPLPPLSSESSSQTAHPLDDAIQIAYDGLEKMRDSIFDYTAVMVKRERVNNAVGERQYMAVKIRNERETPEGIQPFSVYMKFIKPRAHAGREVIWVNGQNENKLIAHEGGLLGVKTFRLDPDGWLAMKGQRYPIYDAGIENLIIKLIEKAERDREAGDCEVELRPNTKINDRSCTMIQVVHPQQKAPYEFYKAQVFIDNELQVPIRYAAYDWPSSPGQAPQLIEEYTYINLKINVGLTDMDFNPANPRYRYSR